VSELEGRVAVVTGAASGIGRATALRLARAGARVLAADVEDAGEATAREIGESGAEALFARLDVTDEAGWRRTVARLFTKAVALECARDQIRVNSIHPGAVRTPMWEKAEWWPELVAKAGSAEAAYRVLESATPAGRMADPAEVADAILYLVSDASRFVTGSELVIDGGFTAQ
jgi:NAD(P)-dependent dehydrogenase (short-subunit alcohol dehydrogenase family)